MSLRINENQDETRTQTQTETKDETQIENETENETETQDETKSQTKSQIKNQNKVKHKNEFIFKKKVPNFEINISLELIIIKRLSNMTIFMCSPEELFTNQYIYFYDITNIEYVYHVIKKHTYFNIKLESQGKMITCQWKIECVHNSEYLEDQEILISVPINLFVTDIINCNNNNIKIYIMKYMLYNEQQSDQRFNDIKINIDNMKKNRNK